MLYVLKLRGAFQCINFTTGVADPQRSNPAQDLDQHNQKACNNGTSDKITKADNNIVGGHACF